MMQPWSKTEVEIIVPDYFDMLIKEINRTAFNKAEHRKRIFPLLENRSKGSIEYKHQNISAVLVSLGMPYISGYLPRYNYQRILKDQVIDYLLNHSEVESNFKRFTEKDVVQNQSNFDFRRFIVPPPISNSVSDSEFYYSHQPFKVNFLEKEQANKSLGVFGEKVIIKYERWFLIQHGKEKLAEKVEWISKEVGDGAGFDILSKNPDGTDKFIEVKTTRLGKETPFYFSANELQFSIKESGSYHLYRLFNAESNIKLFKIVGALNTVCKFKPTMYRGYF